MNSSSWSLLALFLAVLLVASWPLGIWLARLSAGTCPVGCSGLKRLCSASPERRQTSP